MPLEPPVSPSVDPAGTGLVVVAKADTKQKKRAKKRLIQRNSSALLKPLESVEWMKALRILRRSFSQNQAAEKAD